MAITFPRADIFTASQIKTSSFLLNYRQSFSRDGGGRSTVVDFREPYWQASFVSAVISEDDCIELEAALMSLDGMARQFLVTDTRRPYPRRMVQGAITGVQITGVNFGRNLCSFAGLPPNAVLSQGDRFSFEFFGTHYLFALAEGKVANGSGVAANVEIRPRMPGAITFPRDVTLSRPTCSMKLDPASVSFASNGSLLGTVSFSAAQIL